ncbi:MAG: RNA pseudouridine synthase, partial [Mesorhizobium sp.]
EGGLIKARKRREDSRDEALSKLSTKPDRAFGERGAKSDRGGFGDKPRGGFGDKPRGKKSEREQRPIEPPGQRKANVW